MRKIRAIGHEADDEVNREAGPSGSLACQPGRPGSSTMRAGSVIGFSLIVTTNFCTAVLAHLLDSQVIFWRGPMKVGDEFTVPPCAI